MPHTHSLKLRTLVDLRWWTLGALLRVAGTIQGVLQMDVQWAALAVIMGAQALSNLAAKRLTFGRSARQEEVILTGLLGLDILLLTAMLHVTGGPLNPFALLYIAHVALGAVVLPVLWSCGLTAMACVAYATLFVFESSASHAHHDPVMLRLHLKGMWYAMMITATLVVFFISRVKHALERREAQLAQARASRDEQNRLASLAMLSAVAAHELSTPLSTIALISKELMLELQSQGAPQAQIEDTQVMRQQVDHCHAILQHMAADAGQSLGEVSTKVTLEQIALDVQRRHPALILEIDDPEVDLVLPRHALAHTLSGLVRNAYEAQATRVSLRAQALDHERARLLVVDDGVGMSDQALLDARTPFHSTKPTATNLGLGLHLAGNLIDRVGGQMELHSSAGEGTTVTLTLPLRPTYMEHTP